MAVPSYSRAASQAGLHKERTRLRLVARDTAAGRDFSEPSVLPTRKFPEEIGVRARVERASNGHEVFAQRGRGYGYPLRLTTRARLVLMMASISSARRFLNPSDNRP
jgi:hypothetical protein